MKMNALLVRQRGQNTAEYLIMLTLVAIGSIALMTMFGKTIQAKIAYVSAAISGDTAEYTAAKTATRRRGTKCMDSPDCKIIRTDRRW